MSEDPQAKIEPSFCTQYVRILDFFYAKDQEQMSQRMDISGTASIRWYSTLSWVLPCIIMSNMIIIIKNDP